MALAIALSIWLVWFLRAFVVDLLLALIVAMVLDPAVKLLYKLGIKRSLGSAIVFILALAVFIGTLYLITRPLYNAGVKFSHQLPSLVNQAQTGTGQFGSLIKRFHIDSYVQANSSKLTNLLTSSSGTALGAARKVLSGVVSIITIFLLALFIEIEAPSLYRALTTLVGRSKRSSLVRVRERLVKAITGFVLGNVATSIIAGIVVYVTLLALGVPFAIVLAVWVALVDLLPLVGGLLAGVPTVLFAFLHSVTAGVITAVVFIVYQQIENHILSPLVMARAIRLNPLWVLIAVLVGAHLFGFIGALIGIPAAATIQVVGAEIIEVQQAKHEAENRESMQLTFDDQENEGN
ncbi:MAG: AI-2E family transporter [Actinobacteria bacterium]|jgi:predicted PurR-regulated permease PerM|nr:AI-2E family transporter [Actinomycetota bacterium]